MRKLTAAFALAGLLCALIPALAQDAVIPPPPEGLPQAFRTTFTHGLQLLAEGNFAFAEGHFRGIYPPRPALVYVNLSCIAPQLRHRCERAVAQSLATWNGALPGIVEFVRTEDESRADAVVQFEPDLASTVAGGGLRYVCGTTQVNMPHDGQWVERTGLIRIALNGDGPMGPIHSTANLIHVLTHELGHFLGLGESSDKADIMGPDDHAATPSVAPSPRDLENLKQLLALADQLTALAERKEKVPMPASWQPPKQARTSPSGPSATSPKPGEKAPDFHVTDLAGKPQSLSAYAGKPILLDFWATWCGPCKADLPNLKRIVQTYAPKGLVVLGVSLDSDEKALRDFLQAQGITWPQMFDGKGWQNALAQQYNVRAIPQSLLIGADGVILRREYRAGDYEEDIKRLVGGP